MTLKKKKRSKPTAKQTKRPKWSLKENKEINKHFQKFFDTGECPGKADCLKAMELSSKNNGEIHKRHWENIKKKVNNEMTSRMKKSEKCKCFGLLLAQTSSFFLMPGM